MITVHLVQTAPDGQALDHAVPAQAGQSVMQAAVKAGVDGIAADCGGVISCGTCHVYVREPWAAQLPPPGGDELALLEFVAAERRPASRLSCQIVLTAAHDGLTADLPSTQY
jgi:ferredoxin, 2Fe-2S